MNSSAKINSFVVLPIIFRLLPNFNSEQFIITIYRTIFTVLNIVPEILSSNKWKI